MISPSSKSFLIHGLLFSFTMLSLVFPIALSQVFLDYLAENKPEFFDVFLLAEYCYALTFIPFFLVILLFAYRLDFTWFNPEDKNNE